MAHLSPELVQSVLDCCPTGILVTSADGTVTWENATLSRLLGAKAAELEPAQLQTLTSETPILEITNERGETTHLRRHSVAAEDQAGTIHYFADCTEQVRADTEKAALEEQVETLSLKDSETGLMNQRGLMLLLEPQVSLSRRYENPLSTMALCADCASAGDGGLLAVSRLLRDQLRWADLVGRDDEGNFVVILPETGREAAVTLGEKITQRIIQQDGVNDVRVGVTEWDRVDNAATLLRRAQQALAEARNREDTGIVAA